MSTKSESNISPIDIFKVDICLEAPRGKLTSKCRWGGSMKRGGNFFSRFCGLWGGGGELNFFPIFSGGKKYAGRYVLNWIKLNFPIMTYD